MPKKKKTKKKFRQVISPGKKLIYIVFAAGEDEDHVRAFDSKNALRRYLTMWLDPDELESVMSDLNWYGRGASNDGAVSIYTDEL